MIKNDLKYYDLRASSWWEEGQVLHLSNHFNQTRFTYASNHLANWQNCRVLDVGCGGGLACEFMARLGARVSGIDRSKNSIEIAQAHAKQSELQINYQQGNAEDLPYQQNSFDCVVCFDVLEHVYNRNKVISEIYRVLKPGGIFFFDTINRTFQSKLVMIWLMENILRQLPQGLHDWHNFIQPYELEKILRDLGFIQIELKGFDVTNGGSLKILFQILTQGLKEYHKDGLFPIKLNDDLSVCYIGKAVKC